MPALPADSQPSTPTTPVTYRSWTRWPWPAPAHGPGRLAVQPPNGAAAPSPAPSAACWLGR